MTITKRQLQFIINSDVEELVALLQQDYGLALPAAFDCVYNSQLYAKLINTRTGLYIQSPLYQYDYLKEELSHGSRQLLAAQA